MRGGCVTGRIVHFTLCPWRAVADEFHTTSPVPKVARYSAASLSSATTRPLARHFGTALRDRKWQAAVVSWSLDCWLLFRRTRSKARRMLLARGLVVNKFCISIRFAPGVERTLCKADDPSSCLPPLVLCLSEGSRRTQRGVVSRHCYRDAWPRKPHSPCITMGTTYLMFPANGRRRGRANRSAFASRAPAYGDRIDSFEMALESKQGWMQFLCQCLVT